MRHGISTQTENNAILSWVSPRRSHVSSVCAEGHPIASRLGLKNLRRLFYSLPIDSYVPSPLRSDSTDKISKKISTCCDPQSFGFVERYMTFDGIKKPASCSYDNGRSVKARDFPQQGLCQIRVWFSARERNYAKNNLKRFD